MSVKQAYGMSSNVGVSGMVYNSCGTKNKADKYIERLDDFSERESGFRGVR